MPGPLWAGFKPERDYDIALRPDDRNSDPTLMDDIVVKNVTMFRAEAMQDQLWWFCCYLDSPVENDRITFWASVRKGKLQVHVTELPDGDFRYEDGRVPPV